MKKELRYCGKDYELKQFKPHDFLYDELFLYDTDDQLELFPIIVSKIFCDPNAIEDDEVDFEIAHKPATEERLIKQDYFIIVEEDILLFTKEVVGTYERLKGVN